MSNGVNGVSGVNSNGIDIRHFTALIQNLSKSNLSSKAVCDILSAELIPVLTDVNKHISDLEVDLQSHNKQLAELKDMVHKSKLAYSGEQSRNEKDSRIRAELAKEAEKSRESKEEIDELKEEERKTLAAKEALFQKYGRSGEDEVSNEHAKQKLQEMVNQIGGNPSNGMSGYKPGSPIPKEAIESMKVASVGTSASGDTGTSAGTSTGTGTSGGFSTSTNFTPAPVISEGSK